MRTRFGDRLECDGCDRDAKFYRVKARRSYACEHCGYQVYPTAGTPFERTRTPLRDWFFVMFQFCASRNGVAAKEVERQLGVTYKTAWRMCHEIRKYMGEVDGKGKTVVFGMKERGGDIVTGVVPNRRSKTLLPIIRHHVKPHTIVHTDELHSYGPLGGMGYYHETVNHAREEYVSPKGSSVNGIEGFWAMLKRGINGTHIHVSSHHLPKYLAEFEYRHNMRKAPHLMLDRLMVSFAR
jgi:transposase